MKTNILRKITAAAVCLFIFTGLSSCSKKGDSDGTSPSTKGKTAKFTISVNGAPESAYISFVMAGGASNASSKTVWKVNNVTRENEQAVSFGRNDFSGSTKTYVIESVAPLDAISVGVQCLSPADVSYTISYKAEINGEVKANNQNVSVTKSSDFTHDYSY